MRDARRTSLVRRSAARARQRRRWAFFSSLLRMATRLHRSTADVVTRTYRSRPRVPGEHGVTYGNALASRGVRGGADRRTERAQLSAGVDEFVRGERWDPELRGELPRMGREAAGRVKTSDRSRRGRASQNRVGSARRRSTGLQENWGR